MKHPWAVYRERVNLTQVQVAERIGVERLSIIRYEQGMFGSLNTETLSELAHLYHKDPEQLSEVYHEFQRLQRQEFAATHSPWIDILRNYEGLDHPLKHYREYYELSRNAFCKALCIDYAPVTDYENNKQKTIPSVLKDVSEEMRWDYTGLESSVLEWRASGRSARIK